MLKESPSNVTSLTLTPLREKQASCFERQSPHLPNRVLPPQFQPASSLRTLHHQHSLCNIPVVEDTILSHLEMVLQWTVVSHSLSRIHPTPLMNSSQQLFHFCECHHVLPHFDFSISPNILQQYVPPNVGMIPSTFVIATSHP